MHPTKHNRYLCSHAILSYSILEDVHIESQDGKHLRDFRSAGTWTCATLMHHLFSFYHIITSSRQSPKSSQANILVDLLDDADADLAKSVLTKSRLLSSAKLIAEGRRVIVTLMAPKMNAYNTFCVCLQALDSLACATTPICNLAIPRLVTSRA